MSVQSNSYVSDLRFDHSGTVFQVNVLGDNFRQVTHVSVYILSKALTALCSRGSFQGSLYSKQPQKIETVLPFKTKRRRAYGQYNEAKGRDVSHPL